MGTKFKVWNELPEQTNLSDLISPGQFRRITFDLLPQLVRNNVLAQKCNSFILSASGNENCLTYHIVGLRPDKQSIDEDPFIFYFDKDSSFVGIIHHSGHTGRTTMMTQDQKAALSASGLTANFTYKSIPPGTSGYLVDLKDDEIVTGVSWQFDYINKKRSQ